MIEPKLCECGCGLEVTPGSRFRSGHNRRGVKTSPETIAKQSESAKNRKSKPIPEPVLCACGCGEYALPGNRFIHGHQNRGKDYHEQQIRKLCECGCGKLANRGCDYILGHSNRGKILKPKPEAKLCECGCGLYALPGCRFIYTHQSRGTKVSPKTKSKISESHKGTGTWVGKKNPKWKDDTSYEPYCEKFNGALKQQVRDRYDNCDFISGLPDYVCNVLNGKVWKLDVHHVDGNKNQGCDDVKWKLVPLSRKNHSRISRDSVFWERLICYVLDYDETYYYNEEIIDVFAN